jgi:two-component system response regulator FixJ
MLNRPLVCVVDDDDGVRRLTCRLLEQAGNEVKGYSGAAPFFAEFDESRTACVVTDLRMPGTDGGQLLERLRSAGSDVAVVLITGHADVRTAVHLMEHGALTLLEKPYEPENLRAAVERAIAQTTKRREERTAGDAARQRFEQLTEDERDVLQFMITGVPNKTIASRLTLSARTVDRRRNAVLTKMGVGSVSELASLVTQHKLNEPRAE